MSKIEWTEKTWNPIAGCSRKSAGCENCYAEKMTKRLAAMGQEKYKGLLNEQNRFNGVLRLWEPHLLEPFKEKTPTTYFVNSMSDLFHANVEAAWIDKVFGVMALCPQHIFQILTKRPERMLNDMKAYRSLAEINCLEHYWLPALHDSGFFDFGDFDYTLSNVWLGISVESPKHKNRIDTLRQVPAAIRFLSLEPLLADLGQLNLDGIHWVIAGGESGPGARPVHPDWVRSIRDQCIAAGVPFFFKQWGGWKPCSEMESEELDRCNRPASDRDPDAARKERVKSIVLQLDGRQEFSFPKGAMQMFRVGKKKAGRILDGKTWDEMPTVSAV